jgi:glycosyltransferase involved in cell wall biosynthesis
VKTLVVVPAFNEEDTVNGVVDDLIAAGYEVVVVDDGSADMTGMRARRAGAVVLPLPVNLGVGGALRCGFRYAVDRGYEIVVQCDADGQHLAEEIAVLLDEQRRTQAHLVVGSRFAHTDPDLDVPALRRAVMRRLARSASKATGTRISDATSGFRCIVEPLLGEFSRSYPTHYLGDTYEALVVAGRAGYRVSEVPVGMRDRRIGTSTASTGAAVRFVLRAVIATTLRVGFRIRPYTQTARSDRLPPE